MVNNADLFSVATSGINASSQLLSTTSNNIANVNTEGYVREQTLFSNQLTGGVGPGHTERVIDVFAQNQLRRDITEVGEWDTYFSKASAIDNLMANEANSIATGLSDFFASIQTAADDPTNLATRDLVLSQADAMLGRMSSISEFLNYKEEELNLEFESILNEANSLIESIGDLNTAILTNGGATSDQPTALLNERDRAINALAELVSIDVRQNDANGSVLVNLTSGESLVLEDGSFNLLAFSDDADANQKTLQLATDFGGGKADTEIRIKEDNLGGALGGLFNYRDEILGPTQRDIGQLAVAFADAVNQTNNLGMDLDFQLGGDLFTLPVIAGLPYSSTSSSLEIAAQFTPGLAAEVTDADIKVTVTSVSAGVPDEVTIEFLNGDGSAKLDEDGQAVVYTGIAVGSGYTEIPGGIEIEFQSASGYSIDDEFLIQPVKYVASDVSLATTRAEDLAFASPIRIDVNNANLGDAEVIATSVTNTEVDSSLGSGASAFDGAQGVHDLASSPSGSFGAPVQVVFTSETSFEVYDGETPASLITTVTGVTDYNNLLEQAEASGSPTWPAAFSALDNYPGYDFSLQGIPVAGDSFTIAYNTAGSFDNSNALAMASLQDASTVQLSTNSTADPRTFHESYSTLVSQVGESTASASVSLAAAEAMKEQSTEWFESVSGVSLDEEAANLVRYQQSYAAAARILSTAQELFDTILSSVR